MISLILLLVVAIVLAITLGAARQARLRERNLENQNRAMRGELERHRETAQSILRELQNP